MALSSGSQPGVALSMANGRTAQVGVPLNLQRRLLWGIILSLILFLPASAVLGSPDPFPEGAGDVGPCHGMADMMEAPVNPPVITVRFANPQFDCETEEYCVDVEFNANMPNQRLYNMNVRFWYEQSKLGFIDFRDFEEGYNSVQPSPPLVTSYPPGSQGNYVENFNLSGTVVYVNGAVKLGDPSMPPVFIPTSGYTKLYQVCFTVNSSVSDPQNFCPALIWDLEQNPSNGGYPAGSGGVVITVYTGGSGSSSTTENVNQFNWQYIGNGAPPFGEPVSNECISVGCGPVLNLPPNITITCSQNPLPGVTGQATATTPCQQGSPMISFADTTTGACPNPNLITRTWMAEDLCGNATTGRQYISRGPTCVLTVNTPTGIAQGSFFNALDCALPESTILFGTGMAGQTVTVSSKKIIGKDIEIISTVNPRVKIQTTTSPTVPVLFEILPGTDVYFEGVDIISGPGESGANNNGAAFDNKGSLELKNVSVFKHPNLPMGKYVIRNKPSSQFLLVGNNFIEFN